MDVDLLRSADGSEAVMPSGYDEMTPRAYPDYAGGTAEERKNRDLLRHAMEQQGFSVYSSEWWHFDYRDWKLYPILNIRFEDLDRQKQ